MLVQNWMTTEVITVTPETSLLKIGKLMRDNSVRRLPVLDDKGHVVGIISDRAVRLLPHHLCRQCRGNDAGL